MRPWKILIVLVCLCSCGSPPAATTKQNAEVPNQGDCKLNGDESGCASPELACKTNGGQMGHCHNGGSVNRPCVCEPGASAEMALPMSTAAHQYGAR